MAFSLSDYSGLTEFRRGGSARVYCGTQISLGRRVVIKEMLCSPMDAVGQKARFENEARAAASLQHDNIIHIYDFGTQGDACYIAMEHIDGFDLEQLLAVPDLPRPVLLAAVVQALKGLRHAHRAGIVHRDVKPANILVARDGRVRMADFGLAYALSQSLDLTASGMMVGTPQYMSPEQVNGSRHKDPRMDVWSAGVVLYRILANAFPFEGDGLASLTYSIMSATPPPVKRCAPECPAELARCVDACLKKDPADRPAALDDLIDAVQHHLIAHGVNDPVEALAQNPVIRRIGDAVPMTAEPVPQMSATRIAVAPGAKSPRLRTTPSRHATITRWAWAVGALAVCALMIAFMLGNGQRREAGPLQRTTVDPSAEVHSTAAPEQSRQSVEIADSAAPKTARASRVHAPTPHRPPPRALPAVAPAIDTTRVNAAAPVPASLPSPEVPASVPETGEVELLTFPAKVVVSIDGSVVARPDSDAPMRLPVGSHTIAVSSPGYRDQQRTVSVKRDELVRLKVKLEAQ